jgi:hypothetical protein
VGLLAFWNGMHAFLEENYVPLVNSRLLPYKESLKSVDKTGVIVVDDGMYPLIQLGSPSIVDKAWYSTSFTVVETYEIQINGYVLHDDNDRNAEMIMVMADCLTYLFEATENFHLQLPGCEIKLFYDPDRGTVPLSQVTTDTEIVGNDDQTLFLRSFTANWQGSSIRTLGQGAMGCSC